MYIIYIKDMKSIEPPSFISLSRQLLKSTRSSNKNCIKPKWYYL